MTGPARLHLGFPLRLDRRGRTAVVDEEAYLRGLVEHVLFTRPGERVNRPDFGSGVHQLVFAPSGDELARATQALVQGSVQQFLGDLVRVDGVAVRAQDATLEVIVTYTPLRKAGDGAPRTLRVSGGLR